MANVLFKRGLSANLPSTAVDGVFYLTTDTNRLYVGNSGTLAELNRYVKVVATLTELNTLPGHKDDFVYVTEKNILAVCNADGTGTQYWTQINPDTNTNDDTKVTGLSVAKVTEGTTITFTATLNQKTKDITGKTTDVTPITATFTLTGDDIGNITAAINVGVSAAITTNKATVTTTGTGSSGTGFTIAGGGSVTVGGSANAITISGVNTTYDLTSPANSTAINLVGNDTSTDTVTFTAGNKISVTGATAGQIKVGHASISTTTTPETAATLTHGGKFTALVGYTADTFGHITDVKTKEFTLPADKDTKATSVDVSLTNGDLGITVNNSDGSTATGTLTNGLYYTVNGTKVYPKGTIDFYTKAQIDSKIKAINAMVYKGTVGTDGTVTTLPTTGVQIGHTYKVVSAGTYASVAADVGDLFIANGTEDSAGNITSTTLTWDYVPSGDDTDTQYTFGAANNVISLTNKVDSGDIQKVTLAAGNDIGISTASNTITIKHQDFTSITPATGAGTAVSPAHGGKFTVVDAVKTDNGHVTQVVTKEVTLPADNNTTYTLPAASVTANESAKITLTGSNSSSDPVFFDADRSSNTSLSVTVSNNDHIVYEHTDYSYSNPTTTAAGKLSHGGTLTVVTGANVTNGHVTGLKTTSYTLPADNNTTYTITGASTAQVTSGNKKGYGFKTTLTGSNTSSTTSTMALLSESLTIGTATAGSNENARYTVELEWGTF